jgi:hypothetical protein
MAPTGMMKLNATAHAPPGHRATWFALMALADEYRGGGVTVADEISQ